MYIYLAWKQNIFAHAQYTYTRCLHTWYRISRRSVKVVSGIVYVYEYE